MVKLKSKYILKILFFVLISLLISSCSVFQSKYVEIEEANCNCYEKQEYEIIENKLIEANNSEFNDLTFKIIDSKRPESKQVDYPYAIKIENELINHEIIFDFQTPISVKNNQYNVFTKSFEPNISSSKYKSIGTIDLRKKGKREIIIGSKVISTGCVDYITKTKVLRSEWNKRQVKKKQ